jgi:hypothetical protein
MASVNGISLAVYGDGAANSAVALSLKAAPRKGGCRRFPAEQWEIETQAGKTHVVARTTQILEQDALLDEAIEMIHRALDLISVHELDHLATDAPANNHIALVRREEMATLHTFAVVDFPVQFNVTMEVRRADGTIEGDSIGPPLSWTPAFRFHRLSQDNDDLFDAFRNLYLGLEAILDQLWPKQRTEGEKQWLDRVLLAASAQLDFASFAKPGASDPIRDVSDRLYDVRVHLFHAKTGRTLIPDQSVGYLKVADAYDTLMSLWTGIVRAWLGMRRGDSAMTYVGFRKLMEPLASTRIAVTADDTTDGRVDVASPKGMPVVEFAMKPRIVELRPGHLAVTGETPVSALPAGQTVGRILVTSKDGIPLFVNSIPGGIDLAGVETFETTTVARLINRGQPRTQFS